MTESTNANPAGRAAKLNQLAERMVNLCETTLRDVLCDLKLDWEGDAQKLFVSRMETLREEVIKDANNLLHQTRDYIL